MKVISLAVSVLVFSGCSSDDTKPKPKTTPKPTTAPKSTTKPKPTTDNQLPPTPPKPDTSEPTPVTAPVYYNVFDNKTNTQTCTKSEEGHKFLCFCTTAKGGRFRLQQVSKSVTLASAVCLSLDANCTSEFRIATVIEYKLYSKEFVKANKPVPNAKYPAGKYWTSDQCKITPAAPTTPGYQVIYTDRKLGCSKPEDSHNLFCLCHKITDGGKLRFGGRYAKMKTAKDALAHCSGLAKDDRCPQGYTLATSGEYGVIFDDYKRKGTKIPPQAFWTSEKCEIQSKN